jgi:hypothetical protein
LNIPATSQKILLSSQDATLQHIPAQMKGAHYKRNNILLFLSPAVEPFEGQASSDTENFPG